MLLPAVPEVAGDLVTRFNLDRMGYDSATGFPHLFAPGMESASAGWMDQARDHTGDDIERLPFLVHLGDSLQESAGVRVSRV
jgi:hypothetical protein